MLYLGTAKKTFAAKISESCPGLRNNDGADQYDTGHHLLEKSIDPGYVEAGREHDEQNNAEQHTGEAADAAADGGTTDDGCSD